MSYTILPDACINCGACEFSCPMEAIHPPASTAPHPAYFWIDTCWCNDCACCVPVCPTDCILPDPDTFVCAGRGCPVAEDARGTFASWECSRMGTLCDRCGHVLWRPIPAEPWTCLRCGADEGARRHLCPKVLSMEKGKTGAIPPRRSVQELYAHRDGDISRATD